MPENLATTSAYACKDFGRGSGEGVVVGLRVVLEWLAMFRREMKLGFISFLRNQDKNSTQPSESPDREGWLEMERRGKRGWMARGRG